MFINRPVIFALLVLALISQAKAHHPFDFFEESLDDFEFCLKIHSILIEEYEWFEQFENLENVLNETVELKFKCNIKCQLERQPKKWLNDLGKMDLESMSATSEAAESIAKCMETASDEPCAYAFKLVICAFESGHSVIEFESYDHILEETAELAAEQAILDESDFLYI
ncbi:general odorant-binding protein 57a-like [Drosophila rhopaloa]|uniref:General odorant-binding protein 57a-like n=1 Tax=Drosophila rhopaloa TaxID=1041015 RepID=A0A6P4G300_DRORH|nr:general odorant-binding protein 57a-like [Drosophila rhopaloa]